MERKQLSARQLLFEVYSLLKDRLNGKEIKLPPETIVEIASAYRCGKRRIGYTGYETAILSENDKEWVVAFGTKCGGYPANPYNCDIAAILISHDGKSDEEVAKEIYKALKRGSYFSNSLIYAMADGQLFTSKYSQFGQKVFELLRPKVQKFRAPNLEIDSRYFTMDLVDLHSAVESTAQYKPEFAVSLFVTFCEVLAL